MKAGIRHLFRSFVWHSFFLPCSNSHPYLKLVATANFGGIRHVFQLYSGPHNIIAKFSAFYFFPLFILNFFVLLLLQFTCYPCSFCSLMINPLLHFIPYRLSSNLQYLILAARSTAPLGKLFLLLKMQFRSSCCTFHLQQSKLFLFFFFKPLPPTGLQSCGLHRLVPLSSQNLPAKIKLPWTKNTS